MDESIPYNKVTITIVCIYVYSAYIVPIAKGTEYRYSGESNGCTNKERELVLGSLI